MVAMVAGDLVPTLHVEIHNTYGKYFLNDGKFYYTEQFLRFKHFSCHLFNFMLYFAYGKMKVERFISKFFFFFFFFLMIFSLTNKIYLSL